MSCFSSSPCRLFVITRRSYKFCLLATVLLLSSCYDLSKPSRGFTSLLTSSLLLCILPEQISFQSNSNGKRIKTTYRLHVIKCDTMCICFKDLQQGTPLRFLVCAQDGAPFKAPFRFFFFKGNLK